MRIGTVLVLLLAGCSSGGSDRERAGDVAWHAGRWVDAMADYRAAGDAPRLTAKIADAAMQAGALSEPSVAKPNHGPSPYRAHRIALDGAVKPALGVARSFGLERRQAKTKLTPTERRPSRIAEGGVHGSTQHAFQQRHGEVARTATTVGLRQ